MTEVEVVGLQRAAFGDGFEEYAAADMPRLLRLAALPARNSDAAHDLVQETLIRVGTSWGRIRKDGNPSAYATTTMSRLACRQSDRRRREAQLLRQTAYAPPALDAATRID